MRVKLVRPSSPTLRYLEFSEGQTIDLQEAQVLDVIGQPWGSPTGRIGSLMPLVAHFHQLFLVLVDQSVCVTQNGRSSKTETRLLVVAQTRRSKDPLCIVSNDMKSLRFVQQAQLSLKLIPEIRWNGTENGHPVSYMPLPKPFQLSGFQVLGATVRGTTPYAVINYGEGVKLEDTALLGGPPSLNINLSERAVLYAFWNQRREEVARSSPTMV